jgi:nucleoside-diphosphate-sugar epimerase
MLLMTEQKVIESGVSFAIVRFGGLVGPNRHPGKFITSSKKISNLAPVNMLHLKDAVRSIEFVNRIRRNVIVNVVSPANISQADFYKRAIYELGNLNEIVTITDQAGKKVSSKKIVDLGFDFHYESPMDYFKNLN